MVHVVFAVRRSLKHSVFRGLLGPKFRANFLKNRFLSLDVMQRGAGGSGDNVHLTLCIEKLICESSLTWWLWVIPVFCNNGMRENYRI